MNAYLMILFFFLTFSLVCFVSFIFSAKVTIFLCSGWVIILLTIFPIYLMLMISDDRHVMAVCWFKRIDMRSVGDRSFDKDYYWFEVQILLTTLLTIFLPISLIIACNIRVLTIGRWIRIYMTLFINTWNRVGLGLGGAALPWDLYGKQAAILSTVSGELSRPFVYINCMKLQQLS